MTLSESHLAGWFAAILIAIFFASFVVSLVPGLRNRIRKKRPSKVQPEPTYHTSSEELAIGELRRRFSKGEEPPERLLLQLAWSRGLDVDAAESVWRRHLAATNDLRIQDVSDDLVRNAYKAGFCVRSGVDVDGRPMIWVRLALSVPSGMTAAQVVKNTWMAQDATLASGAEANRQGICFVYDLKGVGLKNVSFDPRALRAVIRGALSHPCHISRVWLLDAPQIFLLTWHAFKHFIPAEIRKLVRFADTGAKHRPGNFSEICPASELPVYLGGDRRRFSEAYCDWMFYELEGHALAYRPPKLQLPVPLRRNRGRHSGASCSLGVRRLFRCFCLAWTSHCGSVFWMCSQVWFL